MIKDANPKVSCRDRAKEVPIVFPFRMGRRTESSCSCHYLVLYMESTQEPGRKEGTQSTGSWLCIELALIGQESPLS